MSMYPASRSYDAEFLSELQLVELQSYALPGAIVRRSTLPGDERLVIRDPKSSDLVTFYEHVAAVKHKPSMRIFVAFQETMDALYRRLPDPVKNPKWLMEHPVMRTELKTYIYQAYDNPRKLKAIYGHGEEWWEKWLTEVKNDRVLDTLAHYFITNSIVKEEMFARSVR